MGHTIESLSSLSIKYEENGKNLGVFLTSIACLFALSYLESLFVAYLFLRKHPMVFPLSRPPRGQYFCEYFILLKTSLKLYSSFDHLLRGRISIQLLGEFGDSPLLELRKGRGTEYFLKRGCVNIFVYHSPYDLGDIKTVKFELINDAPYEIEYIEWRPCYVQIIRPDTRQHWACIPKSKLRAYEFTEVEFDCETSLGDKISIFKSIMWFHKLISLFNRPVRYGLYSNIINTIMIYFAAIFIICLSVLNEYVKTADDKDEYFPGLDFLSNRYFASLTISAVVFVVTFVIEILLRNTVPKFCCQNYKTYTGLSEAVKSPYILRDFFINYNWDEVKPLISQNRILIIRGSRHGYTHSIFHISPPHSVHNLWGFFTPDEQKEWSIFMRSMNAASLPLPLSMRWLSKEAWSNIEQVMMTIQQSDFKANACLFHMWLQDWPLNYAYEPQQAGMIISNIICRNLLTLIKRPPDENRSRLARLCVFQWYGLIAFIFLRILMQEADRRNEATLNIKAFIYRVVDQHSFRSPAEIQMNWQKRKDYMKIVGAGKTLNEPAPTKLTDRLGDEEDDEIMKLLLEEKDKEEDDWDDMNMSAFPLERAEKKLKRLKKYMKYFSENTDNSDTSSMYSEKIDEFSVDSPLDKKRTMLDNAELGQEVEEKKMTWNHDFGDCPGYYKEENENQEISRRRRRSRPTILTKVDNDQLNDEEKNFYINMNNSNTNNNRSASTYSNSSSTDDMRTKDRELAPLADFEMVNVGKPYIQELMPMPNKRDARTFYRHKDEISGYCCNQDRCAGYLEIHQKIGHSTLEVLKKLLTQLLFYALDSRFNKLARSKSWLRKKMVKTLYESMQKKAGLFDNSMFKTGTKEVDQQPSQFGYISNTLLTANYTILKTMLEVININRQVCKLIREKELELSKKKCESRLKAKQAPLKPLTAKPKVEKGRPLRCLFCARKIKKNTSVSAGCDLEKLVKFFSRDTCIVAEKEINMEFQSKLSIQNYCAMVVNISKKELLIELEDPPLVLSTRVIRAMIYQLLDECFPKHTNLKDMSVEELRRIGTRRQRIQARHDTSLGNVWKESFQQKRRKALVQALIDEFAIKWRVTIKENTLSHCAQLLSQCLVQERILGLSIYSGFISKDHERLLNNSKDRLHEIEEKANIIVMDIARTLFEPLLKELLDSSDEIDVLFTKQKGEISYFCEAISVMQVSNVPRFLKTACFYIDDIVNVKIQEFKAYNAYVGATTANDLKILPSDKNNFLQNVAKKSKFKCQDPLIFKEETQHMNIASPILRWGNLAIKGEPPLQNNTSTPEEGDEENMEKNLHVILQNSANDPLKESMVSNLIKARKAIKNYVDTKQKDSGKELQTHLARVQAKLVDQIAVSSTSMADAYVIDTDYQREYLPEELFNVEFFCTGEMRSAFPVYFGYLIILCAMAGSCFFIFFSLVVATSSGQEELMASIMVIVYSLVLYFVVFETIQCIIISFSGTFLDSFSI